MDQFECPEAKMTVEQLRELGEVRITNKEMDGYKYYELNFVSNDGKLRLIKTVVEPIKWGDIPRKSKKEEEEARRLREEYMKILDNEAKRQQEKRFDDQISRTFQKPNL